MPNIALVREYPAAEYEFFQLLRVLETDAVQSGRAASRAIGLDEPLVEEFLEFDGEQDLAFQTSPITKLERVGEPGFERAKLHVACFGLLGSSGVLPAFYSDILNHRVRVKDTALKDLLDGFSSRSISLLYRAWQKSRIPISLERRQVLGRDNERDIASDSLGSYVGIKNLTTSQNETLITNSLVLYFSGYYGKRPRSAYGLKQIVSAILGVDVTIDQYFPRWFQLSDDQQNSLGSENVGLGNNFVVGSAVYEGNSSFRIRTEPVDFRNFQKMLPGQKLFLILQEMVCLYVGQQYVIDFQVVIKKEEVPQFELSEPQKAPKSSKVGTGLWLTSGTQKSDAKDAVFALNG